MSIITRDATNQQALARPRSTSQQPRESVPSNKTSPASIAWSVRAGSISEPSVAAWLAQAGVRADAMIRLCIVCDPDAAESVRTSRRPALHATLHAEGRAMSLDALLIGDGARLEVRRVRDRAPGAGQFDHIDAKADDRVVLRATFADTKLLYAATAAWSVLGVAGGRYELDSGTPG
jgi:hypothetical protein